MNILHLANHCHCIGNGIMNVAVDLACEQARMGHQVRFASAGGSYVHLLNRHGVEHTQVAQYWREPQALLRGVFRLRRLIAEFRPEVVHAHMMGGALMARALNTPRKFALVTCVHNEWQRTSNLMRVGDRVIAVSEHTRRAMKARGFRDTQLCVVRNGPVGSARTGFEASPAPPLQRPSVLTVCGLYRRKGVADLIAAFARIAAQHPAATLYIAGDGPDRAAFVKAAEQTGLGERIVFLGFVASPAALFAQAEVFALPSHSEPFGLVFAEAREAGCAIVGYDVGGVPEVLDRGAAGLLVPAHDLDALADALDHLLGDNALRESYRRRARENLEWLTCARMAAETLDVYRDCLRAAPAGAAGRARLAAGPR